MKRRFLVDSVKPDATGHIDLNTIRRHLEVVRANVGDVVYLFDGCGTEVEAEISIFDGCAAVAAVRKRVTTDTESALECWLIPVSYTHLTLPTKLLV